MSIQNICIIILGSISLLALFDLRKKTKELDGLKCKFEREPLNGNEQPNENYKTIILQLHKLEKQIFFSNIVLCIVAIVLVFLSVLMCKMYMSENNIQQFIDIFFVK